MSEDTLPESWGDFRAVIAGPGAKVPKARTVAGRTAYEGHGRKPRGRPAGPVRRQIKMTVKVSATFRRDLERLATARGETMAECLEAAIAKLEAP
jgi:hypothetical protein